MYYVYTLQKYAVYDEQNALEVWHIPFNCILYVDNGDMVGFSISAPASKWGRREVWLAFCAADRRLKTNLRTPNSLLTDYYRGCPGVPEATRAPKSDIIGTFINVLSFPSTKNSNFYCQKSPIGDFWWKSPIWRLWQNVGDFGKKISLDTFGQDHKVP